MVHLYLAVYCIFGYCIFGPYLDNQGARPDFDRRPPVVGPLARGLEDEGRVTGVLYLVHIHSFPLRLDIGISLHQIRPRRGGNS